MEGLWESAGAGMGSETSGLFSIATSSQGTEEADQWRAFCVTTEVSLLTPLLPSKY